MSKKDNLSDFLVDLYQGISSKKPGASRNPQNFRSEIEQIETKSPEWDGGYETSPDTEILGAPKLVKKTVTENKTYYASEDGADGYSEVSVEVPIPNVPEVTSEERTVTPTKAVQVVTPQGADYLSKVTVEPIPDAFIQPTDNKHITENGENIDVREYATVSVDVASSCDRPLGYWFFTRIDQVEDMEWDDEGNDIYIRYGIKESVTVPPQVQDGSATSFENLFQAVSEFPYDYSALVNTSGLWVKKIEGVINCANVTSLKGLFAYCDETEEICPIINTENVTDFSSMFVACSKLKNIPSIDIRNATNVTSMIPTNYESLQSLYLKNIRMSITIGNSYLSPSLPLESLIGLCYELVDTGSTKTLTIGTKSDNLEKLADVYVKLVDITDEMREEDEFVAAKKPFVVCESTDEGATLITDYVTTKNWTLK